jgi:hypothetical protein
MVTKDLFALKTFEGIRGNFPVFLGDELHDKERMESNSSWYSLALNWVNFYGLSFMEYVSIKLNGLI